MRVPCEPPSCPQVSGGLPTSVLEFAVRPLTPGLQVQSLSVLVDDRVSGRPCGDGRRGERDRTHTSRCFACAHACRTHSVCLGSVSAPLNG